MKFTDNEMLFLNSIQDGKPIFGIELQKPAFIGEEYVEKTISGLKEKGLIEENGTLKDALLQPALSLELYKNADTYMFINHMRIAICNEKQIVAIIKEEESYEFLTCETWEFLYLLISNSKVLNENLSSSPMPSGNSFNLTEVLHDLSDGLYHNGTFIYKYKEETLVKEFIFIWNDDYIDVFDGMVKVRKKLNGQQARLLLLELFELSKEEEEDHGF